MVRGSSSRLRCERVLRHTKASKPSQAEPSKAKASQAKPTPVSLTSFWFGPDGKRREVEAVVVLAQWFLQRVEERVSHHGPHLLHVLLPDLSLHEEARSHATICTRMQFSEARNQREGGRGGVNEPEACVRISFAFTPVLHHFRGGILIRTVRKRNLSSQ